MVNFIVRYVVRYFENLELTAVAVMRPMAWLAFVAACTPLVIGSCVVLSEVITDQREMYDASLNWLCAVGIFPWVAIGLATTVLMLVNVVFTAVTLESESKFD
jgi:hypothetical protein